MTEEEYYELSKKKYSDYVGKFIKLTSDEGISPEFE